MDFRSARSGKHRSAVYRARIEHHHPVHMRAQAFQAALDAARFVADDQRGSDTWGSGLPAHARPPAVDTARSFAGEVRTKR
jgi:hypothetical protein